MSKRREPYYPVRPHPISEQRNSWHSYLLTYLLTPWCRVLLEKLTGLQLVKKFPAFHGTRRFITALTSVRHLCLSWARPIQSIYQHPTSRRSILILSTHQRLGLPSGLLPSGFPTKILRDASPRNTPPRRTEWGSSLPPDCFISRGSIMPASIS